MNATSFDSLSVARKLRAAGFEQGPAEALAESLHEVATANRQDLATKADLLATKADLLGVKSSLDAFEARLKAEMVTIANRDLVATLVALGVLFAALKLF